jgi:hypothetical protein
MSTRWPKSLQHLACTADFRSSTNTPSPRGSETDLHITDHTSYTKLLQNNQTTFRSLQEILTSVNSIVKNRTGSVLARKNILKSDHFNSGHYIPQEFHLQGAPNFRMTDYNVFGVAQPTLSGISTILTLLSCHPGSTGDNTTVFISSREEPMIYLNWRPFVLREDANPLQNIKTYQGISGSRLDLARVLTDLIA